MPHEVESMFYVRNVPWQGLGKSVQEAPDSEHALRLAGLDWAVEQAPVHVNGKVIEQYLANVRATDKAVLGMVGEKYRVFQNREAFNFTDSLLGQGVRYETAGSLYGGRRVWILAHEYLKALQERASLLQQFKVTSQDWRALVNHLLPLPVKEAYKGKEPIWQGVYTRQVRRHEALDFCHQQRISGPTRDLLGP